jgi:ferredoxin-NADP reductase
VARTALRGRLNWQLATVVDLIVETPTTKSIVLSVPEWQDSRAGQHVDVRLTAEDGYQAERSYSIASAPEDENVVITVECLEDGEVSPYLTDVLQPGDELELRGPIGGYFVWEEALGGPLFLVAGGSGVVPFRAILRHHRVVSSSVPARLLYSARTAEEIIYRDELERFDTQITLTREQPEGWKGCSGRVNGEMLDRLVWPVAESPLVYICGPTGFVEAVAELLVMAGHQPGRIRTERFGPTGR